MIVAICLGQAMVLSSPYLEVQAGAGDCEAHRIAPGVRLIASAHCDGIAPTDGDYHDSRLPHNIASSSTVYSPGQLNMLLCQGS